MNKLIHKAERLEDFEKQKLSPQQHIKNTANFRFFSSADCLSGNTIPYRRRDFYKVSLLRGEYIVNYGDESIKAFGASLSFFSPSIPYTIEEINEEKNAGYFIFSEVYYDTFFNQSIKKFPLFNEDFKPIFILNEEQEQEVITLFSKIEKQSLSDYSLKDDLIRNHLNELMHYANNLSPASERHHSFSSKERLHTIFNELLDRQFPADKTNEKLLRTASDFADVLNVHVNYLNRILKETTGKSTSMLIYDRLLTESVILLKHTNWNVADIAYSLGFKDSSHFNHFFRKQANAMPSDYRKQS
ncbi:helix-turn-helix transcriptional regulator [Flavobacterium sp. MC2016-06]|jgi:AraC family transcriptional activator of pobA|uniref:helix-turn-helix domain-containing protein n=1 Tax=Flavobacterium sp. MC2016-06 TaxID=2676308 RepID=UPI0012BA9742|nr:AraC family transcriptional regulator [Flavobacterium sp. MC2016-06]MBU3860675.1 helix-turn-helix transcriptional regulator [Flavobacterium sp. MC2016-06]